MSLYKHFPSKDDLILAVLAMHCQFVSPALTQVQTVPE